MSDFRSDCGCAIHVAQWTSKRKVASVKHCPLHGASKQLLEALKRVLPMVRACKHEDFGDVNGNEDTRTEALKNALDAIAKAEGRT